MGEKKCQHLQWINKVSSIIRIEIQTHIQKSSYGEFVLRFYDVLTTSEHATKNNTPGKPLKTIRIIIVTHFLTNRHFRSSIQFNPLTRLFAIAYFGMKRPWRGERNELSSLSFFSIRGWGEEKKTAAAVTKTTKSRLFADKRSYTNKKIYPWRR